jgi:hypothetical protein
MIIVFYYNNLLIKNDNTSININITLTIIIKIEKLTQYSFEIASNRYDMLSAEGVNIIFQ